MKSASETVQNALQAKLTSCKITSSRRTMTRVGVRKKYLILKAVFELELGGKKASRKMEWSSEDGASWDSMGAPGEVLRAMTFLAYGSSNVDPGKKQSYPHIKWMAKEIHKQIWAKARRHARTKKVSGMGRENRLSEERKEMLVALQTHVNDLYKRYGQRLRRQDVVEAYTFAVNREKVRQVMED